MNDDKMVKNKFHYFTSSIGNEANHWVVKNNMSFVKQLAGETAIYGISSILSRIVNFVFLTGYLTRIFTDQSQFGIHQDLYAYMALLLIIFTYRMETAYFRMGSLKEDENKAFYSALTSIAVSTVILCLVMLICKNELAVFLEYANKEVYIIYMLLIIGLDALAAIPFARLRLQSRPLRFAFIKVVSVLLTIFLVIFFLEICPFLKRQGFNFVDYFYRPSWKLDLVFIANIISSGVVLLLLWPLIFKSKFEFNWLFLKRMFWYVLPLVLVSLAAVFNQSFAVPLLKYLLPDGKESNLTSAGVYAAAAKLALLMNLFTQAFTYAAEPFFFKRAKDENAQETYADVAQAFTLVASAAMLAILLYLDNVVVYLIGPAYRSGINVVPILLLAYWFLGLYYNFSLWYKIKDKTYMGALISLGGAVITLIITATLIPKYGAIAMAWASLACYVFMAIASFITGVYHYPVPYPIGKMLLYLVVALGIYGVNEAVKSGTDIGFIGELIISTALMCLYLVWMYLLDKQKVLQWIGVQK
ncbi:MAG: oligosaccharide flippase family protein [Saprospiraceae bacterium]|nr:oligosaccharide flippase family protein [Saprospiraceae bacterium]